MKVDEDVAECSHCENMCMVEDCITVANVLFAVKSNVRMEFKASHKIVKDCFGIDVTEKARLAKAMLKAVVNVVYDDVVSSVISINMDM